MKKSHEIQEIWKDIPGYEGLYQISDLGNVKSLERVVYRNYKDGNPDEYFIRREMILNPAIDACSYRHVRLTKDLKTKLFKVHCLVAETFIRPYNHKTEQVHHCDGNTANNALNNLIIMDKKDHLKLHKHRFKREKILRKKRMPILCIDTNEIFDCQKAICRKYNLYQGSISFVLNGKMHHTKNYHFRYLTVEETKKYYENAKTTIEE